MNQISDVRIELCWCDDSLDWFVEEIEGTPLETFARLEDVIPESHAEGTSVYGHRVCRILHFPRTGHRWDADVPVSDASLVWKQIEAFLFASSRRFPMFRGLAYRVYGEEDESPINGVMVQDGHVRSFGVSHKSGGDLVELFAPVPLSTIPAHLLEGRYSLQVGEPVDWVKEGF